VLMLFHRHDDVMPPCLRMKNSVPVHPAVANVLGRVEDDPLVAAVDEIEVAEIRKKIRLHNAENHGERSVLSVFSLDGLLAKRSNISAAPSAIGKITDCWQEHSN
jgi:hypothetical protein